MISRLARVKFFQEFSKRYCSITSTPGSNFLKVNPNNFSKAKHNNFSKAKHNNLFHQHEFTKTFCSAPPDSESDNLTCYEEVKMFINQPEPSPYHDSLVDKKIGELLSFGVDSEVICEELCQLPISSIYRVPYKQLEIVFKGLNTYQFDPNDCFRIINFCSDLYYSNMDVILDRMMFLIEISPRKVDLSMHVPKSPYLLTMDENNLRSIVMQFSNIFGGPELRHLLEKNPDVMLQPWEHTAKKIFYIHEEMGLDQPHMAFNRTLSHPFPHIRNRHQLLKRNNRYKLPKMHKDRLSYLTNPQLEKIMDSTPEAFLEHIAGVTPEEYYVFEFMMAEEFKESLDGVPLDIYDEEEEERLEMEEIYGKKRKPQKLKGYYIGPKKWEKY